MQRKLRVEVGSGGGCVGGSCDGGDGGLWWWRPLDYTGNKWQGYLSRIGVMCAAFAMQGNLLAELAVPDDFAVVLGVGVAFGGEKKDGAVLVKPESMLQIVVGTCDIFEKPGT